jgi:hypothetical protein
MDALLKALWLVPNLALVAYLAVAVLHPAVRPAGFPLAAAGLAAAILNLPQGREILFVVAENAAQGSYRPFLWGGAGLLLLSMVCWYAARRILYAPPDVEPRDDAPEADLVRGWWPRIAATLPWLGCALALVRYPGRDGAWWWALALALLCLLAAATVVGLLLLRGHLLPERSLAPDEAEARTTWHWLILGIVATMLVNAWIWLRVGGAEELLPILSTYLGLLLVWLVPQQLLLRWSHRRARTVAAHNPARGEARVFGPRLPWLATGALVLIWGVVTWLAHPVRPLAFATLGLTDYGALAIFCLGWSGVVLFFSALSFWVARDRRIPGTAVAAAILLWGMFLAGTGLSDNHALWQGASMAAAAPRKPVEQHLRKWLQDRNLPGGPGSRVDQPIPLVLVAAHGGGLRAAYWTALTLAELEEREPGFHCRIFAVAGISGGSVGTLAWYANLPRPTTPDYRCGPTPQGLVDKVDAALSHDFLATLVGGFLGPDLPAHFVPGALAPDRQLYFESAIAMADAATLTRNGRPLAFRELVRPDPEASELPALFLIATDAGNGQRVVASDLKFDGNLLKNAVDLMGKDGTDGIGAVTAAAASARFPWVSPAGSTVEDRQLLDGGVFEATGAEVVDELLRAMGGWCDRSGTPGVLRCTPGHGRPAAGSTDPGPPGLCVAEQAAQGNCVADAEPIYVRPLALQLVNAPLVGPPAARPILAAPELLGPIGALNAVRGARGEAAYRTLEGDPSLFAGARDQDAPPFARFALDCELRPDSVTLTWTLSAERRTYMQGRAKEALAGTSTRGDDVRLLAWLDRLDGRPTAVAAVPDGCKPATAPPAAATVAHAS